jgi:glycosyltransferase involved in cell wall biosynthesis
MSSVPVCSIVMTSHNYEKYIAAAIESVLCQTFQNWELVIVDDCSTDSSWTVIERYLNDPRVRAIRLNEPSGACAAYNMAVEESRGVYIASLDSDDEYDATKLERQIAFMKQNPRIDVCGSWICEIDSAGNTKDASLSSYEAWFNVKFDLNDDSKWVWQNRLCHSTSIIKREAHSKVGRFNQDLVYTPDWNFWVRCRSAGLVFGVITEKLTRYRVHTSNITHKNTLKMMDEYSSWCQSEWFPHLRQLGRADVAVSTAIGFIKHPHLLDIDAVTARFFQIKAIESFQVYLGAGAIQDDRDLLTLGLSQELLTANRSASEQLVKLYKLEQEYSTARVRLQNLVYAEHLLKVCKKFVPKKIRDFLLRRFSN